MFLKSSGQVKTFNTMLESAVLVVLLLRIFRCSALLSRLAAAPSPTLAGGWECLESARPPPEAVPSKRWWQSCGWPAARCARGSRTAYGEVVAVEGLFAHYKHPSTAIVMGHARGVILLAAQHAGARLVEYKPNEIKKAVSGYGHASKEQIQESIKDLYRLAELPTPADMADAIAIATCAAWREEVRSAR